MLDLRFLTLRSTSAGRTCRAVVLALLALCAAAPSASAQSEQVYIVQQGDTLFKIARTNGLTVDALKALNGLTSDAISIGQRLRLAADAAPVRIVELGEVPSENAPPAEEPTDTPAALPLPEDEYADEPADVGPSLITTMDGREFTLTPPAPVPTGPPPPKPPPATISRVRIGAGTSGFVVATPTAGAQTHVVQAGETLFSIAQRYGTTVEALRTRNALVGDALAVGQQLSVGAAARPAIPAPVAGPYDVTQTTLAADEVHTVRRGETLYSIAARYGTTVERLLAANTLTTAPLAPGTIVVLPDSVGVTYYREPAPAPEPDEVGLALVYPDSYVGRETISGEPYRPDALTASHRTLPFGTVLHVTMPATGRSTLVRVNDRGPVSEGFLIELSQAAAEAIGQDRGAAEKVEVRVVQ